MPDLTTAPLWQWSAQALVTAFRRRDVSPEAALHAVLQRVDLINSSVNAIVTLDAEGATAAAQASARRWRDGESLGPLDGVPVTIKDNILVKGLRATWGSRVYADFIPTADEEPVARLRAAGAVILGKTNVPEFTLHGYTDNLLFGPTRNPWNLELTPGGSSGGAVAALVSGMGPLAIGTDGGGSIRRPAAHNGVFGFKPSRGVVPRADGFPPILHDFEVAGPIARSVSDLDLALQVMAPHWNAAMGDEARPRRILFIPKFGGAPVDPGIAKAVADAAAALERLGHKIEIAEGFDLAAAIAGIWPVISLSGLAWLAGQQPGSLEHMSPALAAMAREGQRYSATDYVNALAVVEEVGRSFDRLFVDFDFLLTPAAAAMPWPATEVFPSIIAGTPVGPRGHAVFTPFANALGLPAISMPCRLWPDELPVGMQLVGRHGADAELLSVAKRYEAEVLPPLRWPTLPEM
jgi:aspartyl-tRNA(Asn)/glutamyl-tRNA(Gln) amidotransferase subunit A